MSILPLLRRSLHHSSDLLVGVMASSSGLCVSQTVCALLPRPLYITVVYRGKCSHCMRIGVAVPLSGTVAQLREAVSRETKIPTKQVRVSLQEGHLGLVAPST